MQSQMQADRAHRRSRSVGAVPASSSYVTQSASRASRPQRHATHRSESSAPRPLSEDGLIFPALAPSTARQSTQRPGPFLPPLTLPGETLNLPASPTRAASNRHAWDVPLIEERRPVETNQEANGEEREQESSNGFIGRILEILLAAGPDTRARKALLSLIFSVLWWMGQFVIVIVLLVFAGTHESPTMPGVSEWTACDRPLGIWNSLWLVKTFLSTLLAVWGWQRDRANNGILDRRARDRDTELATQRVLNGEPHFPPANDEARGTPRRPQPRRTAGLSYEGTSGNAQNAHPAPQSRLYARISLLTSFLTLAWFLAAHVLEYTSVNSCRITSPHLWWLTFGILCTLYLMILEVFLLGLLVFVIGPVVYLLYSIILLCLGRHPLQNPYLIKPEIQKLPKSVVDQIPLVLYIPPPPSETTETKTGTSPVTVPPEAYSYPPKSPAPSASTSAPKRRFAFFRRKKAGKQSGSSSQGKADGNKESGGGSGGAMDGHEHGEDEDEEDVPWDEMWEKGEYPFVRLEGNRAVCAICLMDFEEPKRVRGKKRAGAAASAGGGENGGQANAKEGAGAGAGAGDEQTQEIQVEAVTEEERDALKLNDAGEGAQPLRLLSCGHVFHQTCLDPWLTDVSGRCPICQRPVEVPQGKKKSKRQRRQRS